MIWQPRVIARGLGFPEGPVVLDDGSLAWTEIQGQRVARLEGGEVGTVARIGGGPNGMTVGRDGALYLTNNGGLNVGPEGYWHAPDAIDGRVQRVSLDGMVTDLGGVLPGPEPHRPNDCAFGPDGMLYFTDPANWEDLANLRPGRVNRLDPATGAVEMLAEVPLFPNGIGFGADGRLYVAQSIAMKVIAFDWTADGLGDPKDFATLPAGFPDGFCFTAGGDMIVCGSMGHVIQIFDADGALKQTIEPGDGSEPTNCCIAGGVLYVTMSGPGEIVACDIDAEPLALHR